MRHGAVAAAFVGFMTACGAVQPEGDTGTARLQLESVGTLGNHYKLAKAVFTITGAGSSQNVSDESGQHWITVDLPVGDYSVLLNKGWHLQRRDAGVFVDVPTARLVSANPASATIENQATTDIIFVFDVTGEAIQFGKGRARIGFTVNEGLCGNGVVDPGEECDFAAPDDIGLCGPDCTGSKACSSDAECQSGACGDYLCNDCDDDAYLCNQSCDGAQDECRDDCADAQGTCADACPEVDTSCEAGCAGERDNCLAFLCAPFPPACPVCFDNYNSCVSRCNAAAATRDNCLQGCAGTRTSCNSSCDSAKGACSLSCASESSACHVDCHRCVSCAELGSCPNAP